jgi:hypothetical protein
MVQGRVEVRVFPRHRRQQQIGLIRRNQQTPIACPSIGPQNPAHAGSKLGCGNGAERHQRIELRRRCGFPHRPRKTIEELRLRAERQIENLIADGDPDAGRLRAAPTSKDAQRKVVDREFRRRSIGAVDPAPETWIVRFINASISPGHGNRWMTDIVTTAATSTL